MTVEGGPDIVTSGLVMTLDAANVQSFTANTIDVEYLIVAGGGAGGYRLGGGGGGGGVLTGTTTVSRTSYSITVGNGGSGMTSQEQNGGVGFNGQNSTAFGLTAIGGGGGGGFNGSAYVNAASGGSGGGGAAATAGGAGTTGQGTAGRNGNSGGISSNLPSGWSSDNGYNAGGGGGAGGQGTTGTPVGATGNPATAAPSNGGIGVFSTISGTGTYYGGGGGGHQFRNSYTNASGGLGGGGRGGAGGYSAGQIAFGTPTAGTANTGGGGGGGGFYGGEGGVSGAGGSGVVIVRYPGPQKAKGGTVTTSGGYTIHTFNSSGTLEVGSFWGDINNVSRSGELINGPTYNTDLGGNITFDGTNDYIELNTNNIITGTNPFSFECWYTITAFNNGGEIFGNYGSGYTTNYLWISGEYGIYINGAVYFPGHPLTSGTIHMVATRASNGATVLYRDGVQVNSGTLNGSIPAGPNFRIGADTTSAGGVGAERLNGKIYLQRVYNRVLSAAEVFQNFNANRRRFGV